MNGLMWAARWSLCVFLSLVCLALLTPGAAADSVPEPVPEPVPPPLSDMWVLGPDSDDGVREIGEGPLRAAESEPRERPPERNRGTPNGGSPDPSEAFPFPLWVDLLVGFAAALWLTVGFASQRRLARLGPQISAVAAAVVAYTVVRCALSHKPPLEQVELAVSASLAAAGLVCLVALVISFCRDLWAWSRKQSIIAWSVGLCVLAAVLLHVLLPARVSMVYVGYTLVDSLDLASRVPRYGGGATWLYLPFLSLADPSIQSLQLANRIFGMLTLLPMAVFGLSLTLSAGSDPTRPDPRGLVGLLLFTLLPVVLRDHVSEGIITGPTLLLLVAVTALVRAQRADDGGSRVILALPVLGWALVSRPEMAAVAVVMVITAGFVNLRSSGRSGLSPRAYALWAASLAFWLVPHAYWLWNEASYQLARDAISSPLRHGLWDFVLNVAFRNIFWHGSVLAGPVLLWWAAGLVTKRDRVWLVGVGTMALVWIAQTQVDLPQMSIPRIQLPALVLLCGTVGLGVRALAPRARFANMAIGVAVLATGLVSLHMLMRAGNADHEDELFQTAFATLPAGGGCLAVVRDDDPPPRGKTHRYIPEAMFQSHQVMGLERLYREWESCGPTVAVLGTRCYAQLRADGEPAPGPPGTLFVCDTFRERFDLRPIVERTIPNRTTNTFPMYPDVPTLRVGVYVVLGRTE